MHACLSWWSRSSTTTRGAAIQNTQEPGARAVAVCPFIVSSAEAELCKHLKEDFLFLPLKLEFNEWTLWRDRVLCLSESTASDLGWAPPLNTPQLANHEKSIRKLHLPPPPIGRLTCCQGQLKVTRSRTDKSEPCCSVTRVSRPAAQPFLYRGLNTTSKIKTL